MLGWSVISLHAYLVLAGLGVYAPITALDKRANGPVRSETLTNEEHHYHGIHRVHFHHHLRAGSFSASIPGHQMNRQERDHRDTGRFFIVLFSLAFIYMGALSAALEGWDLMFTICSWLGMTIMVITVIYCFATMFTGSDS